MDCIADCVLNLFVKCLERCPKTFFYKCGCLVRPVCLDDTVDKIAHHQTTLLATIQHTSYDEDAVRNAIFRFVLSTYVREMLDLWVLLFQDPSHMELPPTDLYAKIELQFQEAKCKVETAMNKELKVRHAILLFDAFFSQYNRLFLGYLSTLALKNNLPTPVLLNILLDMHISLCNIFVINASVSLPSINGDLDGVFFEGAVTEVRYDLDKLEIFNRIRKISSAFERHVDSGLFFNNCLITDPLNSDEVCFVSDKFLSTIGYSRDEVIGRNPRFLQRQNNADIERNANSTVRAAKASILNNQTTVCRFQNFTKTGIVFENNFVVKTVMWEGRPVYRASFAFDPLLVDLHQIKSYVDLLLGIKPPSMTCMCVLKDGKYIVTDAYAVESDVSSFSESLEGSCIGSLINIPIGPTGLYNLIHKPEDYQKVLTIESFIVISGRQRKMKSLLLLSTCTTAIFTLHFIDDHACS